MYIYLHIYIYIYIYILNAALHYIIVTLYITYVRNKNAKEILKISVKR